MYKIYVGEQVLHHPNRFPDNYIVANPTMTTELNAHGSLTFKLPPDNPMYSSLQRLKSIVTVRDDYGEIIWRGRVLSDTKSMHHFRLVT